MPIMFNTLLIEAGLSLSDVRLLRHVDKRSRKGLTPYELWRDDRAAFDTYQSIQRIDSKAAFGDANYWASFAGTEEGETLFLGLYKGEFCGLLDHDVPTPNRDDVDKAGTCHYYNTAEADLLKEYVGKLVIDWDLAPAHGYSDRTGRISRLSNFAGRTGIRTFLGSAHLSNLCRESKVCREGGRKYSVPRGASICSPVHAPGSNTWAPPAAKTGFSRAGWRMCRAGTAEMKA
jgi:hypothetical protein